MHPFNKPASNNHVGWNYACIIATTSPKWQSKPTEVESTLGTRTKSVDRALLVYKRKIALTSVSVGVSVIHQLGLQDLGVRSTQCKHTVALFSRTGPCSNILHFRASHQRWHSFTS